MNRRVAVWALFLIVSNVSAQQFPVEMILQNGPPANRINVVVLGDGYLASQLNDFRTHAQNVIEAWFSAPPFREYKNFYNVYMIPVPSNVEGASMDPQQLIDNYFGSTFFYAGIERLLVPTRNDRVSAVLADNFPAYDQVVMIVNSTKYGGSGGWLATTSVHTSAREIAIHEIGHSFGFLADEYWAGPQYAAEKPNMTQVSDPATVKWKNWMTEGTIGIIPYNESPSWYKPHPNCKMQFLGSPFCAVCQEQLVRRAHENVLVVDDYTPKNAASLNFPITFELQLVQPDPNTLNVQWFLNENSIKRQVPSFEMQSGQLASGLNVLEAVIYDSTSFDRQSSVFVTMVTWNIQNSISSSSQRIFSDRPGGSDDGGEVVTGVESTVTTWSATIFPNPSSKVLNVEYFASHPSKVNLALVDALGKPIETVDLDRLAGRNEHQLDITALNNGLYFVITKVGKVSRTMKFIKE